MSIGNWFSAQKQAERALQARIETHEQEVRAAEHRLGLEVLRLEAQEKETKAELMSAKRAALLDAREEALTGQTALLKEQLDRLERVIGHLSQVRT